MSRRSGLTRRMFLATPGLTVLGAFSAGWISQLPLASYRGDWGLGTAWADDKIAPKKYALLVAVSKYEGKPMNQPAPLEFPEADAKALVSVLTESGYNVDLLLGRQATQIRIQEELSKLKDQVNDEGIVLLGFFGHGVEYELPKDPKLPQDAQTREARQYESYFCPWNVSMRTRMEGGQAVSGRDGKELLDPDPERCVGMTRVFQELNKSKAGRRVLIADCCRNDPNAARGRAFGWNIQTTDSADGTAALFVCKSGQ